MGSIEITSLNVGDLRFDLTDIYSLTNDHPYAGQIAEVPTFCYHIALPGRSVLVDAVAYDLEYITETYQISGYKPPPPLLEQLRIHRIEAEQVSEVIITHAHTDHYAALSKEVNGHYQLSFPQAQHYLNAADWPPKNYEELDKRTLWLVEKKGLLNLPRGVVELGDGMTILPLPGETPGHQILHLMGNEEWPNIYFAGDLYHHQIEFLDEAIDARWTDVKEIQASKKSLMNSLASEGGYVYFTHIAGAYRVVEQENGKMAWQLVINNNHT